jgi:hypothetical protein
MPSHDPRDVLFTYLSIQLIDVPKMEMLVLREDNKLEFFKAIILACPPVKKFYMLFKGPNRCG